MKTHLGFLMLLALGGCAARVPEPIPTPTAKPRVTPTPVPAKKPEPPAPPQIKFNPLARLHRIEDYARKTPKSAEKDIQTLAAYLTRYCRSDEHKALAIYAWITSHLEYDHYAADHDEARPDQDAEGVLARRKGVCEGYSRLFVALAQAAGVKAVYVGGYAKSWDKVVVDDDDGHAWNAVYWHNRWHLLDSTWGEDYLKRPRTYPPPYFDVDPEKMLASHFPDDPAWQLRASRPMTRTEFDRQCLRQPEFFELGLELLDTTDYELKFEKECTIRLKAPAKLNLNATLIPYDKKRDSNDVLISRRGDLRAIEVRPPKPGRWTLAIWAKPEHSKLIHLLTYHLENRSSAGTTGFPHALDDYQQQEALLHEPLDGMLKPGRQHFHLTVPKAGQVVVTSEKEEVRLRQTGDDFEGDCLVGPGGASVLMEPKEIGMFDLLGAAQVPLLFYDSR